MKSYPLFPTPSLSANLLPTHSFLCSMKALLTASIFSLAICLFAPNRALAQDVTRPTPSVGLAGGNLSAGPLVRYLAASLQLTHQEAEMVQRALRTRPLEVRTPEQVSQRLQAVLTLDQYDQLLQLQADASTYKSLRCLAMR